MKNSWQLFLLFILAYYMIIFPYVLPEEIFLESVHKCVYLESTCSFPLSFFSPLLHILGESISIVCIKIIVLLNFYFLSKELSSTLCNKLGKDTGICYFILISLQFYPNMNSSRLNKANYEFLLGTLFTDFYIKQSYNKAFLIFTIFLAMNVWNDPLSFKSDFYVFQEIHYFIVLAGFFSFTGKIRLDLRLFELNIVYPLILTVIPFVFKSQFFLPFFSMISAWGLSKMTGFKGKNESINLGLFIIAIGSLVYGGVNTIAATSKIDMTEIEAVQRFKYIYTDMQSKDSNLPSPYILLSDLEKIPSIYLHFKDFHFSTEHTSSFSNFTHIMSYNSYIPEFKVVLTVNRNYFEIYKMKSIDYPKVYTHQRKDIVFYNPQPRHKKCQGPYHP